MTTSGTTRDRADDAGDPLVSRVVGSFDRCQDPRLKTVMGSLTEHLHAFLQEVRPTETEWAKALEFLVSVGQFTNDERRELVLLCDVLGASAQVVALNTVPGGSTPQTVIGPYVIDDSPEIAVGGVLPRVEGVPCWIEGTVTDAAGRPVRGARVEVWETDDYRRAGAEYGNERAAPRAHVMTDSSGRYAFWGSVPSPIEVPQDGPVGTLLHALGRAGHRAPHLRLRVSAQHLRTVVTHVFVAGHPLLEDDCVFGVRDGLVQRFVHHPGGTPAPDGRALDGEWASVRFDVALAPAGSARALTAPLS
ncbi:dioxygenase family protein [Aeromicrobium wangtongii]|uniref:dioxygenase family protein n=1 Tax=Aeromicrobium wangtongii TaxID=2969247 RepID=UPI002016D186|nr:dioxygenase [Aeromicrobium wangtongii]MCL3819989.1 hydroxyquinol 1,2-dioxygenase [Aeromicrobium wangtongii]